MLNGNNIKNYKFEITSFHLHIIAMALMLCDHLWATVVPGNDWLTDIGRIAFPIFAYMTVEGFFHTKNRSGIWPLLQQFVGLFQLEGTGVELIVGALLGD